MKIIVLLGLMAGLVEVSSAQEWKKLAFSVGAGFSTPVNDTGSDVDTGWNVRGGIGYNFCTHVGALVNFGFDSMGIAGTTANDLGYGSGTLNVFSVTLDPVVHITPKRKFDVYVTGGGGYFRQVIRFRDPEPPEPNVSLPIFGFPPPPNMNLVPFSYSFNKPGLDGGVGVAFLNKWGGKFFAEARYVQIFSGSYHTNYVPVTFGFRR